MTYWCPNWTPGQDGRGGPNGCDLFTQAITGYVTMDRDGEANDTNWEPDDDAPAMCVEHDVEATDLGRTMLLQTRALAYEDAGWGYCEEHEEWEEDVCDQNDPDDDDRPIRTPRATATTPWPVHINNGVQVQYNPVTGVYDKVRPRPTTIRSAWAPEGSAVQ